jgi:uncharacterized protein (DUF362 family)
MRSTLGVVDLLLTRRHFNALAAGGVAALSFGACAYGSRAADARVLPDASTLRARPGPAIQVAVAAVPRGADADATARAVRAAADAATDFSWLSRGDTVLIKPACNSGNPYPATTDPVALAAMVRLLRERGAGRVIVADMSGVQFVRFSKDGLHGSTRALLERTGLAAAARDAGAEVEAFEEAGWDGFFADALFSGSTWSGPILLPEVLHRVDHVVLMPRCSRHLLAGSTLGLKAAVGWWRHDSRLEYHRDARSFSEKTADAATVPAIRDRQRLVLTSATRVLTTFGPDQGFVLEPDPGLVFASADPVAHDMVSLAWLLEGRRATPAGRRDGFLDDPNTSGVMVNLANRVVVQWLGGFGQMLRTEHLARYDLERVWDDHVLRRAFAIGGGVPRVEIADAGGSLPEAVHRALSDALALRG